MRYSTPDTDWLFFNLPGLLPENTLLGMHCRLGVFPLLHTEGNAPKIDMQIQMPGGTLALLTIPQFYPNYYPYEHLLSRLFSLPPINPPSKPFSEMRRSVQDGTSVKLVEAVNRRLTQAEGEGKT